MIGPLFWLFYLLTYSDTDRALLSIDDGLVSMVWCKHEFHRRRLNFNGKCVRFQKLWSKKELTKELLNKGWRL